MKREVFFFYYYYFFYVPVFSKGLTKFLKYGTKKTSNERTQVSSQCSNKTFQMFLACKKKSATTRCEFGRGAGLMVIALVSGASGLGSSPGQ